jgi:hypothetical protein
MWSLCVVTCRSFNEPWEFRTREPCGVYSKPPTHVLRRGTRKIQVLYYGLSTKKRDDNRGKLYASRSYMEGNSNLQGSPVRERRWCNIRAFASLHLPPYNAQRIIVYRLQRPHLSWPISPIIPCIFPPLRMYCTCTHLLNVFYFKALRKE